MTETDDTLQDPEEKDRALVVALLELILETVGAAFVKKRVDLWDIQRRGADAAELAKFGPPPRA